MRKSHLSKLAPFALFAILLIPTSSTVYGETSTIKEKAFMKAYDKNGKLIKSYSQKEIKQLNQEVLAPELYKELYKQPKFNDGEPHISYYDENRIMIDSSDKKLLQSQREALGKVQAADLTVYNYPATAFTGYVWIDQGRTFYRPHSVVVDAQKEFSSMTIEIFRDHEPIGNIKIGNFLGRINVPVESFTNDLGEYQIKLTNEKAKEYVISLRGGQVYYR